VTEVAADILRLWREKPQAFVRDVFGVVPDKWQDEALEAFPHEPRLAMKACAGPGKTAVLGWLGHNFLLTRPHARVGATSISGANLKANLWTELARWYGKSDLLQATFNMTATEISSRSSPATWKLEARTWARDANAEQIGNALRGLHGDFILWLLDESGAYPDSILPVCENIFAGSPKEAHIVQAGNPTALSGPLYRAFVVARDLWKKIEITADPDDPKRTPRVSVEHAREQIAQYGADNPWVLVNIFGKFPPSAFNTLIGPDECAAAQKRAYRQEDVDAFARVLGVDVALFGDDASVIFPRQGKIAFPPMKYRNVAPKQGAGVVARKILDWGVDATFVDDTGGFGGQWIEHLRLLGHEPIGIGFATKADDPRYHLKRTEMYFRGVQWIKEGGALPDCPQLVAALTSTTYSFHGDKLLLEPKAMVKRKLGYSPDDADAFALTFAQDVGRRTSMVMPGGRGHMAVTDYELFGDQ
jgi:phage terminase large subunit